MPSTWWFAVVAAIFVPMLVILRSPGFTIDVFDARTMREFDEMCLTEILPMGPQDIRSLRDATGVSQAVLARILNVTPNAVGQWERGEKKPTGSALKLLSLLRHKGLQTIL